MRPYANRSLDSQTNLVHVRNRTICCHDDLGLRFLLDLDGISERGRGQIRGQMSVLCLIRREPLCSHERSLCGIISS